MTASLPASPAVGPEGENTHFQAPWEARVFALAVQLSEQGVFTWGEWVTTFIGEIAEAEGQDYEPARDYYHCWLHALEEILAAKGLLRAETLEDAVTQTLATWPHPPHGARPEPVAISPSLMSS